MLPLSPEAEGAGAGAGTKLLLTPLSAGSGVGRGTGPASADGCGDKPVAPREWRSQKMLRQILKALLNVNTMRRSKLPS